MASETIRIGPQPGPQYDFLSCKADICIFGGAAYGGKSVGLLLDPLRHYANPYFEGVIFRRTTTQIRNTGGLWDTSRRFYGQANGVPSETFLKWKFPSGFSMRFSGLEYESSVLNWQGSSIPWLGWDELTHFTEHQFFFLMAWNRSQSGTPGRIRATCNPDPDSFVRQLIDWWIGKDGYPIKERCGKLRWFIRPENEIIWGNSKEEIYKKYGHGPNILPKSLTFIASTIDDNKIGNLEDPGYRATLMNMKKVDRERLLYGNWNIRATAGSFFRREWFPLLDDIPGGWWGVGRGWDRAASIPTPNRPNPDWTRGIKMYAYPNGKWVIADMKSLQGSPGSVERLMRGVAEHDGAGCRIRGEQGPGDAGVQQAESTRKLLAGFDIVVSPATGKKSERATPFSRQCEFNNVSVVKGDWNEDFFKELENFSEDDKDYEHDDIVDACSIIFNDMTLKSQGFSDEAVTNLEQLMRGFGRPNG